MTRYDKLGRKIPDFDRSAANKKGAATKRKKDPDYFAKLAVAGGRTSTRGYFGKLKEEDPEKLAALSQQAKEARRAKRVGADGAEVRGAEA